MSPPPSRSGGEGAGAALPRGREAGGARDGCATSAGLKGGARKRGPVSCPSSACCSAGSRAPRRAARGMHAGRHVWRAQPHGRPGPGPLDAQPLRSRSGGHAVSGGHALGLRVVVGVASGGRGSGCRGRGGLAGRPGSMHPCPTRCSRGPFPQSKAGRQNGQPHQASPTGHYVRHGPRSRAFWNNSRSSRRPTPGDLRRLPRSVP